jgi:hypothetical protein
MIVRLSNLSARAPQRSDLKAVVELMATCDDAEALRQEDLEEEVRSVWRLVLDRGEIMLNSNSSNQSKLKIDMVLDADNAADTIWRNRSNGVSFAQQYTVYQKELRTGIDAATLDGPPCEDMLLFR